MIMLMMNLGPAHMGIACRSGREGNLTGNTEAKTTIKCMQRET